MQIGLFPLGLLASALLGRGSASSASSDAPPLPSTPPPPRGLREASDGFNVRWITPRQLSQLIERLSAAGQVSPSELADLSTLRAKLDSEHFEPDDPIDLMGWIDDQLELETAKSSGGDREAGASAGLLERQRASLARVAAAQFAEPTHLDAVV